jgi:hypothetical protein
VHRTRRGGAPARHRGQPGHHRAQRLRHRRRPGRGRLHRQAQRRPRNRYQIQAHLPLPEPNRRERAVRYAALRHPEHAASISRVFAIPPKRWDRTIVTFLAEPETDALLAAPDRSTWTGRRDQARSCAIRSYLSTAAKDGICFFDALVVLTEGHPWMPVET